MASFGCAQIDVEDRESSVLADDTHSTNSDATRQTSSPRPFDSCSIRSYTASSPPSPQSTSRLFRFLDKLCCCYKRRRKHNHSTEHLSSSSSQNEANLCTYVEKLEEEIKTCKDSTRAKQLYNELEDTISHIKNLLSLLQAIISQDSDMVNEHREKLQQMQLTSSMSERLINQLTEKEDELHALREQCSRQVQQLEDEKQDQCEQAKQFEIDYRVEVEENELLRAENDTLKHQLDSGLEVYLADEGDDNAGEVDDPMRVISGLKARVKHLNEDINKLRDHSKQQSRQILKYKQQVEVTEFREGRLESLEKMFHDLKEECGQLHKELMDTKRDLQENIQIKEELQNEVATLNEELAKCKADYDQERQDRAEAHSRMTKLKKKGARAKGQNELEREAYHREHQDLKHDYQIAHSQLEQHQQALSAVEEANENLRQEIQAKSSQVKQYAKEVDRLKRELEESRRISEKSATPTGAPGMKQSKLEDLYKTAQDDIQYLSEENSRHQDRIEILEREIEQLRNLQRINVSAGSQASTPYGHKVVDVNPPEQPLYAEEALHNEPYIHHDPVSPLTGQKQSQLAPQAVHVMVDEIEADGPNPYSKSHPLHFPKHPINQILAPEQESAAPKWIRPQQQEKVLAPNFQADVHAPPVYMPPHVAPLPQPSFPQQSPQAVIMPIQPVSTRNDQPYNPQFQLVFDSPQGDQAPQQSAEHYHEVEDNRELEDSTAQFENPLVKELDDEIHQQAAEVIQEVSGGRREVKTDRQRPFDPNLVCPMCRRQFRIGEIQKFKRHVNTCTGTDD